MVAFYILPYYTFGRLIARSPLFAARRSYLMNASTNCTGIAKAKKDRVFIMTASSCILSLLGILAKRVYANANTLPYDPSMLFLLSFIASSMLLSCALTVLACKGKRNLYIITALTSAAVICTSHILLGACTAETLLALAFVPSGVTVSLCIKSGCEKTHTVVANAVVISLVFVLSFLLGLYEAFGEISLDVLENLKQYVRETLETVYKSYEYAGLSFTSSQISDIFNLAVLLLPSTVCAVISVLSYVEATLVRLIVLDRRIDKAEITHWPLKMSRLSSLVFLFAFIVFVFGIGQKSTLFYMTAANLMLALVPGFLLIGIRSAPSRFKRPSLFGIIFGIFLVIYCIRNPIILVLMLAVSGAFDNLFSAFRERFYGEKKENKDKK